jgi:peptidoglycan-associated lipoprotein
LVTIFKLGDKNMQKKYILKILLIGIGVLTFAACSTTSSHGTAAGANAGQKGATTSGMGQSSLFADSSSSTTAAAVCAPCNQSYHFNFDSDVVHQEDMNAIYAQANYLVAHPNAKIRLEGNTDERGSREYNIALGWRRAQALARILGQQGVSPKQIVLISYGEEKPVAFGHDESSYWQNRRDDLVYKER